jgi:hypothetical protein
MPPDASLNARDMKDFLVPLRPSISRWHPLTPSLRIDRALSAHLVRRGSLLRLGRFHTIT